MPPMAVLRFESRWELEFSNFGMQHFLALKGFFFSGYSGFLHWMIVLVSRESKDEFNFNSV